MLENFFFSKTISPFPKIFTNFIKDFLEKIQLTLCISSSHLSHFSNQNIFISLDCVGTPMFVDPIRMQGKVNLILG